MWYLLDDVYMILKNENEELNLVMKFKVDNFDYVIFATSSMMKCFGCGKEGHIIRACPEKGIQGTAQDNVVNEGTSAYSDRAWNLKPTDESHSSEVSEMMDVNTVVNEDVNTVVDTVGNIVLNGEGKNAPEEENNVAAVVTEAVVMIWIWRRMNLFLKPPH